jgi:hypothetical protein
MFRFQDLLQPDWICFQYYQNLIRRKSQIEKRFQVRRKGT